MTANPERGEVAITLGGREYVMRPSFEAMARIEARAGIGMPALASRIDAGDVRLADLAIVIEEAVFAATGKRPWRGDACASAVFAAGSIQCSGPVFTLLVNALTAGRPRPLPAGPESGPTTEATTETVQAPVAATASGDS